MYKRIDLSKRKFNKLTVIDCNEELSKKYKQTIWNCRCDCGNMVAVSANRLINDEKTSCNHCNDPKPGDVFTDYTIICKDEIKSKEKGHLYFKVRCKCGNIRSVSKSDLVRGKTTGCGCTASFNKRDTEDITDRRFGHLVAKRYNTEMSKKKQGTMWDCQCDCGKMTTVNIVSLKDGRTRSCGCAIGETNQKKAVQREKERPYHLILRKIHAAMLSRCKLTDKEHRNYYDRGITVCPEWADPENGFNTFYNDMVSTYAPGLTLDRVDVNDGYYPGNCRWVTKRDQSYNKTNTNYHEYYGFMLCCGEIGYKFPNPANASSSRINTRLKFGFTIDEALNIPLGIKSKDHFLRNNPDFRIIKKPFMFVEELEAMNLTGRMVRYDLGEGKPDEYEMRRIINNAPTAEEYWGKDFNKTNRKNKGEQNNGQTT